MHKIPLFFIVILIVSCNAGGDNANNKNTIGKSSSQKDKSLQSADSLGWINNFRIFRDAVYQNDRARVKQFFDFPIMNGNNEMWYLAKTGNDEALNLPSDSIKPFTEKDFDKYYDKIFSKPFINCLLKIKTQELYDKGHYESVEFKEGKSTYSLSVTVDKEDNTLQLNLFVKFPYKSEDENGKDIEEFGESAVLYYFSILNNTQLKFKQIYMAG